MYFILTVLIFLITVTFHEVCHGCAAYALGDPTAKNQGRLTLNPLKHVDAFWTLLLPGLLYFATAGHFAIGMAKPVPVNFLNLKPRRIGMSLVALAGPLANIALAFILNYFYQRVPNTVLLYAIYLNLGLAIFNLIPIPPLDGSRIVLSFLCGKAAELFIKLERYGFLIVMGLYFTRVLIYMILPFINFFCKILAIPILRFH